MKFEVQKAPEVSGERTDLSKAQEAFEEPSPPLPKVQELFRGGTHHSTGEGAFEEPYIR